MAPFTNACTTAAEYCILNPRDSTSAEIAW
jgi:hypothetical protein